MRSQLPGLNAMENQNDEARKETSPHDSGDSAQYGTDRSKFPDSGILEAFSRAVSGIVKAISPSVVSLMIHSRPGMNSMELLGAGSGVVIAPDGYILTNSHVVHSADRIEAMFTDGQKMEAKVVGEDQATDIAALRVPASGLPFSVPGNSEGLSVGQIVIAIGNQIILLGAISSELTMHILIATLLRKNALARILEYPGAKALPASPGEAISRLRDDVNDIPAFLTWLFDPFDHTT